ncbi:hypothetical protein [Bifidobacterium sp. SO1]|uniref:hypothetical protein n=1 Tax=Bifidobacterium sp. SO1 TaxID=2809029 RepID=UPI001BDC4CE0|nr:hypothetical protein [Bifidobacterium sp. SO1]MBT1162764.1 hypothetical protein [Bifidobacterium sp. SO1]
MKTLLRMIGTFILFTFLAIMILLGDFLTSPTGFEVVGAINFIGFYLPGWIAGGLVLLIGIPLIIGMEAGILYLIHLVLKKKPWIAAMVQLVAGAFIPVDLYVNYPNKLGLLAALVVYLITAIIVFGFAYTSDEW